MFYRDCVRWYILVFDENFLSELSWNKPNTHFASCQVLLPENIVDTLINVWRLQSLVGIAFCFVSFLCDLKCLLFISKKRNWKVKLVVHTLKLQLKSISNDVQIILDTQRLGEETY